MCLQGGVEDGREEENGVWASKGTWTAGRSGKPGCIHFGCFGVLQQSREAVTPLNWLMNLATFVLFYSSQNQSKQAREFGFKTLRLMFPFHQMTWKWRKQNKSTEQQWDPSTSDMADHLHRCLQAPVTHQLPTTEDFNSALRDSTAALRHQESSPDY